MYLEKEQYVKFPIVYIRISNNRLVDCNFCTLKSVCRKCLPTFFQTWDERRYVLSAVTAGIRANWMSALHRAAGLQEPPIGGCDRTVNVGEKIERELDSSQQLASPTGQ